MSSENLFDRITKALPFVSGTELRFTPSLPVVIENLVTVKRTLNFLPWKQFTW